MERVYLLVQETNERVSCWLNPESLVLRRLAGVEPRRSATGWMTGAGLADDPLQCTGGGRTELDLDLLFDVTIGNPAERGRDVRDQTQLLWRLAENTSDGEHWGRPPQVRFLWGKSLDFAGVVAAVAERLDLFTGEGVPQRSWLRLRLLRSEPTDAQPEAAQRRRLRAGPVSLDMVRSSSGQFAVQTHSVVGAGGTGGMETRLEGEPSVGEALWTASEIVASAVASTPAARWVASSVQRLGEFLSGIGERVREWWKQPSPLGEAIKAGLRKLGEGMATLASAAKERIVSAATAVAAQVSAASRAMKAAVVKLATSAEQAIARALEPLLDNLRPVVQALRQAAAVVTTAVKAQVKRIVARAISNARAGLRSIGAVLQSIGSFVSEAGSKAIETLRTAADKIGAALEGVRRAGEWLIMENVAPVLGAMAIAADMVWAAGKRSAARAISRVVAKLGVAFKNLQEAGEAAGMALGRAVKGVVTPAVTGLKAAIKRLKDGGADAPAVIDTAWADLEAASETLPAPAGATVPEPILHACEAIREALPALADPATREAATEQISAALDQVSTAAEPLAEAEEAGIAEAVKLGAQLDPDTEEAVTVLAEPAARPGTGTWEEEAIAAGPPAKAGAVAEEAPGEEEVARAGRAARPMGRRRLAQRERLDQVAFRYYADAAYWRLLALFNGIDDPLHLQAGLVLRVPPPMVAKESA